MHEDRDMNLNSIEKLLLRGETVLVYVAVLATFALMCLTTADAVSRYIFNSPITGAYEITEKYLMVASVFLGFSYAYRRGVFVRVTFLADRLPQAPKLICHYLAQIISLVYCVILVYATALQAIRASSEATTLSTLPIPVGPAYYLVPIGFFAMTVFMLLDLPRVRSGESSLFREETPTA
jgi:TRAP-type C4-dicarboxylate transport system permease small subunit